MTVKGPMDYVTTNRVDYEKPTRIGWMSLPVLEFLNGTPWNADALNLVHALQPTCIRVVPWRQEEKSNAIGGRVNVYLDQAERILGIEQEVSVGLVGRENGHDLSQYVKQCQRTSFEDRAIAAIADGAASATMPMPSLRRWLWWSFRGRCLVCGAKRAGIDTTRCAAHVVRA